MKKQRWKERKQVTDDINMLNMMIQDRTNEISCGFLVSCAYINRCPIFVINQVPDFNDRDETYTLTFFSRRDPFDFDPVYPVQARA